MRIKSIESAVLLACCLISVGATYVLADQTRVPAAQANSNAVYENRFTDLEGRLAKIEATQKPRAKRAPAPTATRKTIQFVPATGGSLVAITPQLTQLQAAQPTPEQAKMRAPSVPMIPPPQIDQTASNIQALQNNITALTATVQQLTKQLNDAQGDIGWLKVLIGFQNTALTNTSQATSQALTTLQTNVQTVQQQVTTNANNFSQAMNDINHPDSTYYTYLNVIRIADILACDKDAFGNQRFPELPQWVLGAAGTDVTNYYNTTCQ
jgi:uncharacterized protein YoxC